MIVKQLKPGNKICTELCSFIFVGEDSSRHRLFVSEKPIGEKVVFDIKLLYNYETSYINKYCKTKMFDIISDLFGKENIVPHLLSTYYYKGEIRKSIKNNYLVRPIQFGVYVDYNKFFVPKFDCNIWTIDTPSPDVEKSGRYYKKLPNSQKAIAISENGNKIELQLTQKCGVIPCFCLSDTTNIDKYKIIGISNE